MEKLSSRRISSSAVDFFVFSFLGLTTLLWASLSSESAGRGAWIRQQNWGVFRKQLLRELGPHSALLSAPMRQLLQEDPGGDGLASEQTLQILRRAATGAEQSVIACADTIVEEAAGSASLAPTSA